MIWRMPHVPRASLSLLFAVACVPTFGQSSLHINSLCSLKPVEGSHRTVSVSGVFSLGLDQGVLTDSACPNQQGTWVELALHSQRNKEKLRRLLNESRQAVVVFTGEFYGPPKPDSNLPDAIRKSYHPGWGHLSAFPTKLVVHEIESVRATGSPSQGGIAKP